MQLWTEYRALNQSIELALICLESHRVLHGVHILISSPILCCDMLGLWYDQTYNNQYTSTPVLASVSGEQIQKWNN